MNAIPINPHSCCFVDTNIWLYAFIQTEAEEKRKKAKDIISHNEVIISTQIINEMSVNLIKKAGFTEKRISTLIFSLYERYTVLELSRDMLLKASDIRSRYTFSYWDSVVAAAAIDGEADYLISEDMQNEFQITDQLTIINPFV